MLNITYAKKTIICFRSELSLRSISTVQVLIFNNTTNLHIIDIFTPFLFYLKDIDIFGIYLNNITNQLICQNRKSILIFYKWEYPWFFINKNYMITASIFLIKAKLCQVYIRFRHPSTNKLHKLLI